MANTNYILGTVVARGGMAEIFLGKAIGEDRFERIVAIKRILPHYSKDKEFVKMFRDEAHICMRLQHANIVQVYDFQEVGGSYAIVMEFVDGSDLRTLLAACEKAKTRLTVPMAVYICAESARGLHYAHTKIDDLTRQHLGIVHRDISPQNILVSFEGEVKITDFGIADADGKMTETKPGIVKGKYSYMSPEQVSAKSLDARSDIFSLAIVLWEILAMKRLFGGQNEIETIKKVQACEISFDMKQYNPDVDENLIKILQRGLDKDRRKRYQSANEFERDLLKYLHSTFPGFNSAEVGDFTKKILAQKRGESAANIKKTLTSTNLPAQGSGSRSSLTGEGADGADALDQAFSNAKRNSGKASETPDVPIELELDSAEPLQLLQVGSPRVNPAGPIVNAPSPQNQGQAGTFRSARTPGQSAPAASQPSELRQAIMSNSQRVPANEVKKPKRSSFNLLTLLGTIAALYVLVTFTPFKSLFSKGSITLNINTTPSSTIISLDGKDLFDGKYHESPIDVRDLPPGKYKLTLKRSGYQTIQSDINAENAGVVPRTFVLKPDPKIRKAPVRIDVKGLDRVRVDIDNGFIGGTAPLLTEDTLFGKGHILTVSMDSGNKFQCPFKPVSTSSDSPFLVILDFTADKPRCFVKAQSN